MESQARDLMADLEICNRATRGPWDIYNINNAEFIAAAREGWPHAIERAIKAEEDLIKTEDEVARLKHELYAIEKNIKRIIAGLDKESER